MITNPQFDLIDLLYTLNIDEQPVTRADLATRLNMNPDAAYRKISRLLVQHGLAELHKSGHHDPGTYRLTNQGHEAFAAKLRAMDPLPDAPPRIDLTVWNASRIASGVFEAECRTETAA
jgi:DNA-binding IclR family transcriptional regulator